MKDIAVYTESISVWPWHVDYAAQIAAMFGANLTGVCVCPSPETALPSFDAPGFIVEWADQFRQFMEQAVKAEPGFLAEARKHGVEHAAWQVAQGYVPECLGMASDWHDLLVLGCDVAATWGSPAGVGDIMLSCDKPCLIVPTVHDKSFALDCIAIAWDGSMCALRAVHTALPLLKRARRVVLLEHGSAHSPLDGWQPSFDIARYLTQHDLAPQRHPVSERGKGIGNDLLQAAAQVQADLLVMGGYGHSRLRERIAGGATREVLAQTTMPVWMHH